MGDQSGCASHRHWSKVLAARFPFSHFIRGPVRRTPFCPSSGERIAVRRSLKRRNSESVCRGTHETFSYLSLWNGIEPPHRISDVSSAPDLTTSVWLISEICRWRQWGCDQRFSGALWSRAPLLTMLNITPQLNVTVLWINATRDGIIGPLLFKSPSNCWNKSFFSQSTKRRATILSFLRSGFQHTHPREKH